MSQTYTAVVKQAGTWWIGWIQEVQERTREKLLVTLRITVEEAPDVTFSSRPAQGLPE